MSWKPSAPFTVPLVLLIPTYEKHAGVERKVYPKTGPTMFGSFKTYGGTETPKDGVISVVDTAVVETFYRPDVTNACALYSPIEDKRYEIISLENIEMRGQYLRLKLQAIKGGA